MQTILSTARAQNVLECLLADIKEAYERNVARWGRKGHMKSRKGGERFANLVMHPPKGEAQILTGALLLFDPCIRSSRRLISKTK